MDTDVVVVGGGVTGLAAARELTRAGHRVVVLEAAAQPGGQIRTQTLAGLPMDVGAEALHLGAPGTVDLLDELGFSSGLVSAVDAPTWVLVDGALHPLPAGLGPMGPAQLGPLARTSMLSLASRARAALEPLFARPVTDDDPTVGAVFRQRFGDAATERMIEPLLGGIYTGDIDRLSLLAVLPYLEDRLRKGESLLRGARRSRRRGDGRAGFVTLRHGLGQLPQRIADGLPDVRFSTPVWHVAPADGGYVVSTSSSELRCAGVVVATPAQVTGRLLEAWPDAAAALRSMPTSPVAVVALAYPKAELDTGGQALSGTGVLLPGSAGRMLKAVTFSSTKWPHLAVGDHYLLRASVGRGGEDWCDLDDAELVGQVREELSVVAGVAAPPVATHVVRWRVPSYTVGHRSRVAAAERGLERERIAITGASYRGVGVSTCFRQGQAAARAVVQTSIPTGATP